MDRGKQAVKAGIGYTLGNILVKGISFLSIPLFARLLSVSDYGIINAFTAYASILFVIVGLALHSSLRNAYLDFNDDIESYCSSLTILPIACFCFFLVISVLWGDSLADALSLEHGYLVCLLAAESFCMALNTYYNSVLALNYQYKEYLILSLMYAVSGIAISVFFIVTAFTQERYLGRIWGMLISGIIASAFILFRLYRREKPRINVSYWKYGLKISLPIIPHGLSQILLSQFDRLMIKSINGNSEAGLYSFAYTLGSIYQVIANSIDTAWNQWFFEQMSKKGYAKIKKTANYYTGLLTVGAIILGLVSPELIRIMGGSKYNDSKYVTLPIVLSMYYAAMYALPASVEYFYKKTKLIAVGTMVAAGLNIILNGIFIPLYGYIAAAYTTLFCYFIYFIMHMILAYRVHGEMIYDARRMICNVAAATVAILGIQLLIDLFYIRAIMVIALFFFTIIEYYNWKNKKWRNETR